MFSLGIEYLTGYAVAAAQGNRDLPEWPPHPARVFMAMAAAHFETGADRRERDALQWLESRPLPPSLYASRATRRRLVTRYVPANDRAGPSRAPLQSAPGLTRSRSARSFPTVRPDDDRVFLVWEDDCPTKFRTALEGLCEKVTRVGHSCSLVRMWLADDPPVPTWTPVRERAELKLRTPSDGLLDHLADEFASDPSRLPPVSTWYGYARRVPVTLPPAGSVWDRDLVILRLEPMETRHRYLDLVSTLAVTNALHRAVLDVSDEPVPEVISGHEPDGSPSSQPHLAYLPLPFSGHERADGMVRGIGVALPADLERSERARVLRCIGRVKELWIGRLGRWRLLPEDRDPPPQTLRSTSWTGGRAGARHWATVTPIAFDRHPKSSNPDVYAGKVEAMLRKAFGRIGLSDPIRVVPVHTSPHMGVPISRDFPRLRRKDESQRRHVHAVVAFETAVRGPIMIGAGRYRGYGFFKPILGAIR